MIVDSSRRLIDSILAWPRGLQYAFRENWVLKYIFTAVIVNLILFVGLITGIGQLNQFLWAWLSGLVVSWEAWAVTLFQVGIRLVSILIALLLFSSLSSIVNAPVFGSLAEKLTARFLQPSSENVPINYWQSMLWALGFECKKLALGVLFLVFTFGLNFIPGIGSVFFLIINFLQLIVLTGLDMFEPAHTLQGLSFRRRLQNLTSNPALYWPFLVIAGLLGSIPVLNIFTNPISIVAAILLQSRSQVTINSE